MALDEQLDRWRDAGLLTAEQADAIRAHEAGRDDRRSLVVEGVGYLGAVLAVTGAGAVLNETWEQLASGVQLAFLLLVTALLAGAGWLLRRRESPALQRLTSVVWALSAAGAAWSAGFAATEMVDVSEDAATLVGGLGGLAPAAVFQRLRPTPLQQTVTALAVVATTVGLLAVAPGDLDERWYGAAVWLAGAAWLAAGHARRLHPHTTALVLGMVGLGMGAQMVAVDAPWELLGLGLGVASAGAVLALGIAEQRPLFVVGAGVGALVFVPQLVFEVFGDTLGAPVALVVAGTLLVGLALVLGRVRGPSTP